MVRRERIQKWGFEKRQVCNDCDWWNCPIGRVTDFFYYPRGLDREVCPSCGSKNMGREVGRVVELQEQTGWLFKQWQTKQYLDFERKNRTSAALGKIR